jgi:signal transduction histidine kinase
MESQRREALIQEQITFVESRHEELREAYLEQEQTRVELRRKVAQLTALHRAGLLFSSTLDREALMQKVLEALTSDLQYARAMVSFYDPVRQVVKDARLLGVSPEIQAFARVREIPVTDPASPEGIVLLQGQPLLLGDVQAVWDRLHPLNQQLASMMQTKAMIAVPLKTKDRILGSLTVDRIQEHSLTQDDLELLMTVAHQVAIALDNASAYEQIEDLNVGLEAKVRERTAELEQADRVRSQFLSHVSHELKTPLTSIKGFLQNLLDGLTGPLNEKQQRYLSRMLENSDRLIRMIEDLLDRTRIQSGRLDLVPVEIDLGHCVADVVEQLRLLAQAKRQTLEAVVPPAPLMVWADRDRLIQIITNLVQNAVKFTPEGGSIMVTVRQEDRHSPGSPCAIQGRVFLEGSLIRFSIRSFGSSRPAAEQRGWGWACRSCGRWWSYKAGRSLHGANRDRARSCLSRFRCFPRSRCRSVVHRQTRRESWLSTTIRIFVNCCRIVCGPRGIAPSLRLTESKRWKRFGLRRSRG